MQTREKEKQHKGADASGEYTVYSAVMLTEAKSIIYCHGLLF